MRKSSFVIKVAALLIAQILVWNFCNFSPLVTLTFLPVIIMSLPVREDGLLSMLIALALGFAADFFAGGMLGLTSFALVPVAFFKKTIMRLAFGSEMVEREEDSSVRKNGFGRIVLSAALATALFLLLYIWADGAGTRPFSFNLLRFVISLTASVAVSALVAAILDPEDR